MIEVRSNSSGDIFIKKREVMSGSGLVTLIIKNQQENQLKQK